MLIIVWLNDTFKTSHNISHIKSKKTYISEKIACICQEKIVFVPPAKKDGNCYNFLIQKYNLKNGYYSWQLITKHNLIRKKIPNVYF